MFAESNSQNITSHRTCCLSATRLHTCPSTTETGWCLVRVLILLSVQNTLRTKTWVWLNALLPIKLSESSQPLPNCARWRAPFYSSGYSSSYTTTYWWYCSPLIVSYSSWANYWHLHEEPSASDCFRLICGPLGISTWSSKANTI